MATAISNLTPTKTCTMSGCIKDDNLEGAYSKYLSTSPNWKARWWATVETIYYGAKKWARKYIIDPIQHLLTPVKKGKGRPKTFFLEDVLDFNGIDPKGYGAYIVQHFDADGNPLWVKPGKANDGYKRLGQHFTKDYKDQAVTGILLGWYPCKNKNHALSVENVIRNHFEEKGFFLLGEDRFPDVQEVTAEDVAEIAEGVKYIAKAFKA